MKTKSKIANFMSPRRIHGRELVLGVDGGGTKTRAIITDARQRVLGEGVAGPSNPLRVGIGNAASAVREAIDAACAKAGVQRSDIVAAEIGLAGVRRGDLRLRMREALSGLGIHSIEVVTDAEIALFGATEGEPGLVIIAGTGSVCCGLNAQGKHLCAGGWGPLAGDEGSGSWIARRALQAMARAIDGRGTETVLGDAACSYFNVATTDDLLIAIYAPGMTNDRIAGFGKRVIEAAQSGDRVAREIVRRCRARTRNRRHCCHPQAANGARAISGGLRRRRLRRRRSLAGIFARRDRTRSSKGIHRTAAPSASSRRRTHGARAITKNAGCGLKEVTSYELRVTSWKFLAL